MASTTSAVSTTIKVAAHAAAMEEEVVQPTVDAASKLDAMVEALKDTTADADVAVMAEALKAAADIPANRATEAAKVAVDMCKWALEAEKTAAAAATMCLNATSRASSSVLTQAVEAVKALWQALEVGKTDLEVVKAAAALAAIAKAAADQAVKEAMEAKARADVANKTAAEVVAWADAASKKHADLEAANA